jgi:CheY-like chemotaxis protein
MGEGMEPVGKLLCQLREIGKGSPLQIDYRIGELVIHALYGGSLDSWRAREPSDPLVSRLREHPELPIPRARLARSQRIYEFCQRLPAVLTSGLALSHVVSLLSVSEPVQEEFLDSLLAERKAKPCSVRNVRKAVIEQRGAPFSGGCPRSSPAFKTLKALGKNGAFDGANALCALPELKRTELCALVRSAQKNLEEVEQILESAPTTSAWEGLPVLLVDANPNFVKRAKRQLRELGCEVRVASSGRQAIARHTTATPCALIALSLPDTPVVKLVTELRRKNPGVYCIVMIDGAGHCPAMLAELKNTAVLVHKDSGLRELRAALATFLLSTDLSTDRDT